MSRKFLIPLKFSIQSNDPDNASIGDTYFSSIINTLRMYNGNKWISMADKDDLSKIYSLTKNSSYSLLLIDAGKIIEMNVSTDNTLTIPNSSSIDFPIGTSIDIIQIGLGQTTIVGESGVNLLSNESNNKLSGQYSGATIYKRSSNEWVMLGDLTQ